jgi:hypothetical protein
VINDMKAELIEIRCGRVIIFLAILLSYLRY